MEMLPTDWCAISTGGEGKKKKRGGGEAFGQSAHLYAICKIIRANVCALYLKASPCECAGCCNRSANSQKR